MVVLKVNSASLTSLASVKSTAPSSRPSMDAHCPRRNPGAVLGRLSALRAHAKAPYKMDLLWGTQRALDRPGRARTGRLRKTTSETADATAPVAKRTWGDIRLSPQ
jgi:hypothetical protein